MILIESSSKNRLSGEISELDREVLKELKSDKRFSFNWNLESQNQVFKITIKSDEEILGLVSIIDFPSELRIHINLIEAAIPHRGKNKPIQNIVGCLIAHVCKLSFKRGYEGFVSLTPKTELLKYYQKYYNFQLVGTQMAVYDNLSNALILKYIGDEEI